MGKFTHLTPDAINRRQDVRGDSAAKQFSYETSVPPPRTHFIDGQATKLIAPNKTNIGKRPRCIFREKPFGHLMGLIHMMHQNAVARICPQNGYPSQIVGQFAGSMWHSHRHAV